MEKSGKEEEVDSKVKELVKENSSKEIIAKDNLGFVGAKVEESESKAKELMPMTYNTVMKELLEVRSGSWNQVQGSTIKQTQMGMGAKDQEEEKLKQKEQIRCSGGLDPGEAIKDKEEQFALKAQVERFVAKDKEVRCAKDWEEERLDGLGGGVARHQGREGGEAEAEGRDGQLGGAVLALRSQSEDAARRPRVRAGSRLADGDSAQVRDAEAQVWRWN